MRELSLEEVEAVNGAFWGWVVGEMASRGLEYVYDNRAAIGSALMTPQNTGLPPAGQWVMQ